MPPIHEDVKDGSIHRKLGSKFEPARQKSSELISGHLARGHLKLAEALLGAHMSVDRHIVWAVGNDLYDRLISKQSEIVILIERIATEDEMPVKMPQVPKPRDRRLVLSKYRNAIIWIIRKAVFINPVASRVRLGTEQPVAVDGVEAGDLKVKIRAECLQLSEFNFEEIFIPA